MGCGASTTLHSDESETTPLSRTEPTVEEEADADDTVVERTPIQRFESSQDVSESDDEPLAQTRDSFTKKKPAPKRRSGSLQRKSGSNYPIIHFVESKDVKKDRRRRSVTDLIPRFSGAKGLKKVERKKGRRTRSLEDIRNESSTAWILSASSSQSAAPKSRMNQRRSSVSVVLSEMTARDILTDNMLENRSHEMSYTHYDGHFNSITELEVYLNCNGVNTMEWGEDKQGNLFKLLSLLQTKRYSLHEKAGGSGIELVSSVVQIRLVHGKTEFNFGKVLHIVRKENDDGHITFTDKLQKFPEVPKMIDQSIDAVCHDYLQEQLGMDVNDIEVEEGGTVQLKDNTFSGFKQFPGLEEYRHKFIVEVKTTKLVNRGQPFRTQILGSEDEVKETITWAWLEQNCLSAEAVSDGEPALREWLCARGVDVREWGKHGNKSVYQLLVEVLSGHCRLLDTYPPFRQCAFVNTRIWNEDKKKVLLEIAEKPKKGSAEVKNHYLSQRVAINDVTKDPNFSVDDIVSDSILEKLFNDEVSEMDRILPFNAGSLEHWGQFSISFESPSYPSLPSRYTVMTTDVIVEGLPQGEEQFQSVEYEVDSLGNSTLNVKTRHVWMWQEVDLANHRIQNKFFQDFNEEDLFLHSNSSLTHQGTPIGAGGVYVSNDDTPRSSNDASSVIVDRVVKSNSQSSLNSPGQVLMRENSQGHSIKTSSEGDTVDDVYKLLEDQRDGSHSEYATSITFSNSRRSSILNQEFESSSVTSSHTPKYEQNIHNILVPHQNENIS